MRYNTMFCYQCEQTAGSACIKYGVCGKSPEVAALQDLLVYITKGVSHVAVEGIKHGVSDPSLDRHIAEAVFITPNILKVLVDNFNLMPISTAEEDLKAILG